MMNCHRITVIAIVCLLVGTLIQTHTARCGPPPSLRGDEQAVLLANDRVLQGTVRRQDDYYVIRLAYGEIRVRATDVAATGRNLLDLYHHKCRLVERCGATERLHLALWCHANGLAAEAAAQLEQVRRAEPNHEGIAGVERRLAATLPPGPSTRHVPPDAPRPPRTVEPRKSLVPLDSLPPGAMEAFARSVQPLLSNRCATSGCHDTRSRSEFSLRPLLDGSLPSQHVTRDNLQAVLPWINTADPIKSPLLTAAIEAHGPLDSGVLAGSESERLKRLALWTEYVARGIDDLSQQPASATIPDTSVRRTTFEAPMVPPSELPSADPMDDPFHDGVFELAPAVQRGAAVETIEYDDPFDPDIFNRRHFPKSFQ